jgi:nucleotide-binding universal stress UspA family protein
MAAFTSILCALDSSPLASRVLRHAVGVAAVCGARLTVLTVVTNAHPPQPDARVAALLREVLPAGAGYLAQPQLKTVQVAMGQPADAIVDMARGEADLIVAGTHSKSGLSRWLLGSTSTAILEYATCPTLLVPPGQLDIVTLDAAAARFHPGAVLAAVDLQEHNEKQLALASELAAVAGQPLVLMTVANQATSEADAQQALKERAAGLAPVRAVRVVVRRGNVADEIDHAAVAEAAGLVVMGLRSRTEGTPGAIATAVLKAKDALVLAVPAA